MKRGDEGDVDGEAGRILDLRDLHPVDLLALLFGNQIDLSDALAERGALQEALRGRRSRRRSGGRIGEDLAADSPREDAADDERDAVA